MIDMKYKQYHITEEIIHYPDYFIQRLEGMR
jgi:hypothetical protein